MALLDIEMPGMDGIEVVAALKSALPGCSSMILTPFGRPGYLRRAMEHGVAGFRLKDSPAEGLASASSTQGWLRDLGRGKKPPDRTRTRDPGRQPKWG